MRKTEFLQELREALDGEVSASVIQSNISYYDQYISQEAAKVALCALAAWTAASL